MTGEKSEKKTTRTKLRREAISELRPWLEVKIARVGRWVFAVKLSTFKKEYSKLFMPNASF